MDKVSVTTSGNKPQNIANRQKPYIRKDADENAAAEPGAAYFTLSNIATNSAISVSLKAKQGNPVKVQGIFDTDIVKPTLAGGKASGNDYLTNNGAAVTVTIGKANNSIDLGCYDIGASYYYEGDTPVLADISASKFTIPADYVKKAENRGKKLLFELTAVQKKAKISIADDNAAGVEFYIYEKGYGPENTPITAPVEIGYGDEVYVYAKPTKNLTIKSVKAGTATFTGLTAQTEVTRWDEKYTFYKVPATLTKNENVYLKAETNTVNYFELHVDDEHGRFNITTSGAIFEDGYWKLPETVNEFAYTIEVDGAYLPDVSIWNYDENRYVDLTGQLPTPVINKANNGLIYTGKFKLDGIKGNRLVVIFHEEPRTLVLDSAEYLDRDVLVKENGRTVEFDDLG